MAENLGAKFTIDVSNLKAGLAQANRMIRESESEFKAAAAGMGDWQRSADGLRAKINQLNSTAEIQREKVRALQQEYDRLIEEGMEPTSAKATLMRTNINNATAAVNKSEQEAKKCAKALDELGNEAEDAGDKADESKGGWSSWGQTVADLRTKVIMAALDAVKQLAKAFVDLGKEALNAYAQFEQLEGGAKKIFDEMDYSEIAKDANDAYISMGMSANQYLESINLVGAAFASTMGDKAGYDTAKQGMQAIADFASGTGKSVELLNEKYQLITKSASSYQSIADQFAGILPQTSADFLEQAQASGYLSNEYKKLTDVPVAEYQQAVTKMMTKGVDALGLAGNTAAEAEKTMSGSFAAMQSSWQNLVAGLADGSADLEQLGNNLIESVFHVVENFAPKIAQYIESFSKLIQDAVPKLMQRLLPLIQQNLPKIISALMQLIPQLINLGLQMITALLQGIAAALPTLIGEFPKMVAQIIQVIIQNLPLIIQAGIQILIAIVQGIVEALPQLIEMIPQIVETIITVLTENLPLLVEAGITLLIAIINGIIEALPQLIAMTPTIIYKIVETLAANMPKIFQAGIQILTNLINGIGSMITSVAAKVGEVGTSIINKFQELPSKIFEVGSNLVKGLWEGIQSVKDWVLDKISGFGSSILDGIKGFFGIASPSKVMRDQVGVNLAKGIGVGFEEEIPDVQRQIQNSIDDLSAGGFTANINGSGNAQTSGKSVTINQTNHYAAAHTRYEIYKSKQDTAAAVKLALMGV